MEKKFQPDTAIEASRLYRHLLEVKPGDTAEETIERVEKARAELLESVSEIKVEELLGALILFKLTPDYKDLVNLVYSTQSSSRPLTFDEATSSIRRLVTVESVGETDSKSLINRTKTGRIKKKGGKYTGKNKNKNKYVEGSECSHCKKPGHQEEKCWFKHPELAPDSFKRFVEEKKQDCQNMRLGLGR